LFKLIFEIGGNRGRDRWEIIKDVLFGGLTSLGKDRVSSRRKGDNRYSGSKKCPNVLPFLKE